MAHAELKLSGLVKRDTDGRLKVRNRIYARLFNRDWLVGTDPVRRAEHARRSLEEREQLASLSITITLAESREGTRIAFPVDASQALLEEIIPLLEAVGPGRGA